MGKFYYANKFLESDAKRAFEGKNIRIVLMNDSFVFDRDAHDTWAAVKTSELAVKNGYATLGQLLANIVVGRDNATDLVTVTSDAAVWTATSADDATGIGPSNGAIYMLDADGTGDDTDEVVGYQQFFDATNTTPTALTATDGNDLTVDVDFIASAPDPA